MTPSAIQCPQNPEETAEAYCLGHLHEVDKAHFEGHYLFCAACREKVMRAAAFVRAMREAAVRCQSK